MDKQGIQHIATARAEIKISNIRDKFFSKLNRNGSDKALDFILKEKALYQAMPQQFDLLLIELTEHLKKKKKLIFEK